MRAIFIGFFQDVGTEVLDLKSRFAASLAESLYQHGIALDLADIGSVKRRIPLPPKCRHASLKEFLRESWPTAADLRAATAQTKTILRSALHKHSMLLRSERLSLYPAIAILHWWTAIRLLALFRRSRTSLLLVWNADLPVSNLTKELCQAQGIRWLCAEGGLVPGSVEVDDVGNQYRALPSRRRQEFQSLSLSDDLYKRAERYLAEVRTARRSKKQQPEGKATALGRVATDRPVVLYAGMSEAACGVGVKGAPGRHVWAPHFTDDADAISELRRICKSRGYRLIFKPHPNGHWSHIKSGEDLQIMGECNLFDVFAASSVVVTMGSSVGVHAVLHGLPVVQIGQNGLTGLGVYHEIAARSELEAKLVAALNLGVTKQTHRNLVSYTARFITHYGYAFTPALEKAFGRTPAECATAIAQYSETGNFPFSGNL